MRHPWVLGLLSIVIAIGGTAFTRQLVTSAETNPPPGPDRITVLTVQYQAFEWQLASWKAQKPICTLIVDHEGAPIPNEIYRDCGETIYNTWIVQAPCIGKNKRICK